MPTKTELICKAISLGLTGYTGMNKADLEKFVNAAPKKSTSPEPAKKVKVKVKKPLAEQKKFKAGVAKVKETLAKGKAEALLKKAIAKYKAKKAIPSVAEQVMFNPDLLRKIGGYKKDVGYIAELKAISANLKMILKFLEYFYDENRKNTYGDNENQEYAEAFDYNLSSYFMNPIHPVTAGDDVDKDVIKITSKQKKFVEFFFTLFFKYFVAYRYGRGLGKTFTYTIGDDVINKQNYGKIDPTQIDMFNSMLTKIIEHIDDCIEDPKYFNNYVDLDKEDRYNEYYSELILNIHDIEWLEQLFPKGKASVYEENEPIEEERENDNDDEDNEYDDDWRPYTEELKFSLNKD